MTKSGNPANGRSLRKIIANQFNQHKSDTDIYLLGVFKDRLLYYAKVTDAITMASYYGSAKSNRRFDNIYACDDNGFKGLIRNGNYPLVHSDKKQISLDIAGEWVIVSDKFTYWGKDAPEIKAEILGVLPKYQEHKPNKDNVESYPGFGHLGIHEHIMSQTNGEFLYKLAEPHEKFSHLKGKGCHQK